MKNWKTTTASAVSAAASFVLFAQMEHYITFPGWAMGLAMFAQVGGLAAFGIAAKDVNVTGGTVGQPSTLKAMSDANQTVLISTPPIPVAAVIPATHTEP